MTRTPPSQRDRVLLFLLVVLNIGSAYTTVLGARQILPWPMSDILGLTVQVMLFLALAGFAARHTPVRKWLVVAVFATASIYTSFFAYYQQLAGASQDSANLDRAHQSHAAFVSTIYQPAMNKIGHLEEETRALYDLAEREGSAGITTGVVGFGPVAKAYAEEARIKELEVARLRSDLDRLESGFVYEVAGLGAEEVYARDLLAWQTAPDIWKAEVVTPSRAAYLDLEQEVALLTPLHKIRRGEGPAVLSILLALVVDGVCVLLGTAIGGGSQAPIADRAAGWIRQAKDGGAMVREAMDRPGLPPEPGAAEMDALEDALHIVVLRIAGRGSDFLTTFYQSIHAETGALDFPTLQAHTNPTYRIAARMLVDRLRRPRLGWVEVRDGWWCVPPEHYARLTFWLGDHIRQAVDAEAEEEHDTEERTLRLVLPAMAS